MGLHRLYNLSSFVTKKLSGAEKNSFPYVLGDLKIQKAEVERDGICWGPSVPVDQPLRNQVLCS